MISWIAWYCSLSGHDYFVEVPDYYIEDDFNLVGLSSIVPHYDEALDMILDLEDATEGMSRDTSPAHLKQVEASAEMLYIYIHARFLLTKQGLQFMASRYQDLEFGVCPRWHCGGCGVIPYGSSDSMGVDSMKLYCPRCNDIYEPQEVNGLI